jgi:hypothetical protein
MVLPNLEWSGSRVSKQNGGRTCRARRIQDPLGVRSTVDARKRAIPKEIDARDLTSR